MIEGASIKISNPDSMGVYKLEKFKLDRFQKLRVLPNRLYVSFNSSKNILTFSHFFHLNLKTPQGKDETHLGPMTGFEITLTQKNFFAHRLLT